MAPLFDQVALVPEPDRCTDCLEPTHASESNDDGVCKRCMWRRGIDVPRMLCGCPVGAHPDTVPSTKEGA